jgi:hypothetical protein
VQDRRVHARGVIRALDLAGPQVELDAPKERRVRVGVEVGIDQVRDLARMAVQLDQVGALSRRGRPWRSPRTRGAGGRGPPARCGGCTRRWATACRRVSGGRRRRRPRRRRPGTAARRPGGSRPNSCRRTIGCPAGVRSGRPTSAAGGGTGRGSGRSDSIRPTGADLGRRLDPHPRPPGAVDRLNSGTTRAADGPFSAMPGRSGPLASRPRMSQTVRR